LLLFLASFTVESNKEDDEHRLEQRFKQIGYGKNTVAYDRYITAVPKNQRKGYDEHPRTPDVYEKVSKRLFTGRVKVNNLVR
jgi:histone RNA hairpin-binding protein